MAERVERCDRCRWWDCSDTMPGSGLCRRYPPQLLPSALEQASDEGPGGWVKFDAFATRVWAFPITLDQDFCGEFTPAEPSP